MEKKLAKPSNNRIENVTARALAPATDEMERKREIARRQAQGKVKARTMAKQQQLAERIAVATEQMASGIEEASSAAEELGATMQQIASGATETASSAEQSRAAINQVDKASVIADKNAKDSLERAKIAKDLIQNTSNDIELMIKGIKESAATNMESVKLIGELEKQSNEVGEIVQAVVRIADQTNLLALNAAIEAARAGEHGKGFAVVADEVRNLAETSEKSAINIKELVNEIQSNVKVVVVDIENAGKAANDEVENAKKTTADLVKINEEVDLVMKGISEVSQNAVDANKGAVEFLGIAEQIAVAAEQQGSAAEEVERSIQMQNKAFNELNAGAGDLAQMAEDLKASTDAQKSSESMAAASEELSANVEEGNSTSAEILKAMEQISSGAQVQGDLTDKAAVLAEKLAVASKQMSERAGFSADKISELQKLLEINKIALHNMTTGISSSAQISMVAAKNIKSLEETTRRIDKIVDAIVNVTIQTNMLAVNGSIEAARAGEFGRGFSVVAVDIRALANESAENTDKIKDLVRGIQNQIQRVSADTDLSSKNSFAEVEKSKKTTHNLNIIEENMIKMLTGANEIQKGSDESLVALEQARKGVDQIAAAAQEASSAAQQASNAACEQSKGMQELAEAIEEISGLADELQNM
ncbi:methyl-accepting chemotaxis protein [Clostridium estertheticum]|uniref:methyl-accepting chemotaxis protein n=1 Tax=Clostridium estertheticum TaxID=238834 RepID=UPI001CF12401|nr:methyl-accepting chemotaxis protein [Clostridium estertheticum]MCB2306200.1 methyl-accepting chemotaxis protein [Clostridium estertheticum]MCB2344373.1 methyl-accepting chemotaxis protein [Clostridium estertheticum]MCB2349292.1 methyl-accepting chemotaxis protein [Clostridium estertheticum]WAG45039.1 methyl-accepting chemotaxis protein [Clostridium estertheticum]